MNMKLALGLAALVSAGSLFAMKPTDVGMLKQNLAETLAKKTWGDDDARFDLTKIKKGADPILDALASMYQARLEDFKKLKTSLADMVNLAKKVKDGSADLNAEKENFYYHYNQMKARFQDADAAAMNLVEKLRLSETEKAQLQEATKTLEAAKANLDKQLELNSNMVKTLKKVIADAVILAEDLHKRVAAAIDNTPKKDVQKETAVLAEKLHTLLKPTAATK